MMNEEFPPTRPRRNRRSRRLTQIFVSVRIGATFLFDDARVSQPPGFNAEARRRGEVFPNHHHPAIARLLAKSPVTLSQVNQTVNKPFASLRHYDFAFPWVGGRLYLRPSV
jgi:hypothetical protein